MKPDQGQHAVGVYAAVCLAYLLGQLEACLEFGDRVIPFSAHEAFVGAEHLIGRKGPADAELLADPPAGTDRSPAFIGPVALDEEPSANRVQRIAVSQPARTLIRQADCLVEDPEPVLHTTAELRD